MVNRSKAQRTTNRKQRRRYRPKYRSMPSIYCMSCHSMEQEELLEAARNWVHTQVSRRKKVWTMPCCGASQTGSQPSFDYSHSRSPLLLTNSLQTDHLLCTSTFKNALAAKLQPEGDHKNGCFFLPFVSPNHLEIQSGRICDYAEASRSNSLQTVIRADAEAETGAVNTFELIKENTELKARINELEGQVARLQGYVQMSRSVPSTNSVACETTKTKGKRRPQIQTLNFVSIVHPRVSQLVCLKKKSMFGLSHSCINCRQLSSPCTADNA